MKLVVDHGGMQIVTESVQDVAYLKHLGCCNPDENLYLKVSVRSGTRNKEQAIEILLKWEDKDSASSDSSRLENFVQHVEGPISNHLQYKKKHNSLKDESGMIKYGKKKAFVEPYEEMKKPKVYNQNEDDSDGGK